MSAVGLGLLGVGMFLMYESYKAYHTKTTAAPLTKAKLTLSKG